MDFVKLRMTVSICFFVIWPPIMLKSRRAAARPRRFLGLGAAVNRSDSGLKTGSVPNQKAIGPANGGPGLWADHWPLPRELPPARPPRARGERGPVLAKFKLCHRAHWATHSETAVAA